MWQSQMSAIKEFLALTLTDMKRDDLKVRAIFQYWRTIGVGLILLTHQLARGEYHYIGCFGDTRNRALPNNLGSVSTVKECYNLAISNYPRPIFGIENGNECWSASDLQTYNKYGEADTCINGLGGEWSLDVYFISVCNVPTPLGMESVEIPDSSISASSSYDSNHAARYARLRMTAKNGHRGGWSARSKDVNQWLQIDLGSTVKVNKIATQGRQDHSQWVTSFQLSYSTSGNSFVSYGPKKVFGANKDRNTIVMNTLKPPILGRFIRILPRSWSSHISMRVELFGIRNACGEKAVGVASGLIPDSALYASSVGSVSTPAQNGRLNGSSSWCASPLDSTSFLEIDLGSVYIICGVATQGNSQADQWVRTFQILFSVNGSEWFVYKEANRTRFFHANFDRSSVIKNMFFELFVAKHIRFLPKSFYQAVCLRIEIFGTKQTTECEKRALWIEERTKFPDDRFTASSYYNSVYQPHHARLRLQSGWGWATRYAQTGDYLQIDLGSGYFICGVATKGTRKDRNEWVTEYNVLVSEDNQLNLWQETQSDTGSQNFPGNKDHDTLNKNELFSPASAKYIRFKVTGYYSHAVLRVEVYGVQQGCKKSLGLECRSFRGLKLTSSSGHNIVDRARLYNYGAWCANRKSSLEYIQVDLGVFRVITGIATQGNSKPSVSQWITTYKVEYSLNGTTWTEYKNDQSIKVLQGNNDRNTVQANWFEKPFAARYVRIFALTWNNAVCLRMDLYGCDDVLFPKIIGFQNKMLIADTGQYVDLECNVRGQPVPRVTWIHDNVSDITYRSRFIVDASGLVQSKLRIYYVSVDDVLSNYSCNRLNNASRMVSCENRRYICKAEYVDETLAVPSWKTAIVNVILYVPAAPVSVTTDHVTSRFTTLKWKQPSIHVGESNVLHYVVQCTNLHSEISNETDSKEPLNSLEIGGLEPYSNYSLRVRGESIVGMGLWSVTHFIRTDSEVPNRPPKFVKAFAIGSRTIEISWKEPEEVFGPLLGYTIIFSSNLYGNQIKTAKGHLTNYTLKLLEEWTFYRIRMSVFNDKGNGPMSVTVSIRTFEDAPSQPPSAVAVRSLNSTAISISWSLPPVKSRNGIIRGYKIKYNRTDDSFAVMKTILGNDTQMFVASGLRKFTEYSIQILAFTIKDGPPTSQYLVTTEQDAPTAPRQFMASVSPPSSIEGPVLQLSWKNPLEVNGILDKYKLVYNNSYTNKWHTVDIPPYKNTTSLRCLGGTTYFLSLAAVTIKEGPPVFLGPVKIKEYKPSSAPANVAIVALDTKTLNVSWEALPREQSNGEIRSYEVKYEFRNRTTGIWSLVTIKTTSQTFDVISRLNLCTEYRIYVRANGVSFGPYSNPVSKKTGEPEKPKDLTVLEVGKTTAKLKWEAAKLYGQQSLFYTISYSGTKSYKASFKQSGYVNLTGLDAMAVISYLTPHTDYHARVFATTECGTGPPSNAVLFTTEIDNPMPLKISQIQHLNLTGTSVMVNIKASDDTNGPISAYQVIVLRTTESQRALPSAYESMLGDYKSSLERSYSFYITAELQPAFLHSRKLFIVGDGQIYNNYENVQLESASYKIYQRSVSRVSRHELFSSATEIASVAPRQGSATNEKVADNTSNTAGLVAGIVVSLIIVTVSIFVLMLWKKRRKSNDKRFDVVNENNTLTQSTDPNCFQSTQKLVIDGIEGESTSYVNVSHNRGNYTQISNEHDDVEEKENQKLVDSRRVTYHEQFKEETDKRRSEEIALVPLRPQEATEECDFSVTLDGESMPIPQIQFSEYYKETRKNKYHHLKEQFKKLPSGQQHPWTTAKQNSNKVKNRYANIIAYDHSRVILQPTKEGETSDYINACYIQGFDGTPQKYIATQGPSPVTCNDFWRMVWQENVSSIVMITNLTEKNKTKCHQYWPEQNKKYGGILVSSYKVDVFADYVHRTFLLSEIGGNCKREVQQFHFTVWPDHGVPQHATSILTLRRRVRTQSIPTSGPLLVHCSAGVGRTGTFIVVDAMLERMKKEGNIDIFNYTTAIRGDRISMIQTDEQYIFVHTAVFEALTCGNTEIQANNLASKMKKLLALVANEKMTGYELEFARLNLISAELETTLEEGAVGKKEENREKNRYSSIIPADNARVILSGKQGRSDYINASFADALKRRNAFILTQAPLSNTIVDFWRMIFEHNVGTIVMLNNFQESNQTFPVYLPSTHKQTHGSYTIDVVSREECEDYVVTKLKVNRQASIKERPSQKRKHTHMVQHFRHIRWPYKGVPSSNHIVLNLVSLVEKSQQRCGDAPIVIHCSDGVGRSGSFAAVYSILERLKLEQVVDVFQTVKVIRVKRPSAVETLDQYMFLYETARVYLDSFSDYANFGDL